MSSSFSTIALINLCRQILLACMLLMALYNQSYACWPTGDVTWTGATNSDWNVAGNYSGNWGALPGNTDRVIVNPDNYTNAPVINSAPSFRPGSVYLQNGALLTVNVPAETEFFEIGMGTNSIVMTMGAKLTIGEDFLFNANNGMLTISGRGDVDVGNELRFENPYTSFINNLNGEIDIGGNLVWERQNSYIENSGTLSIGGDLLAANVSASNEINNQMDAVLNIGGDIDLSGAVNFLTNEGTINQHGNFTAIDMSCDFENRAGGVWNWLYTAGMPDPDMVSALAAGGTVIYGGSGDQPILPIAYNNLTVAGAGIKQLQGATIVNGNLNFSAGHVALNDFDLIMGSNADINNASAMAFVITNGNGKLNQRNIGSGGRVGNVLFPVGLNVSSYTPLVIDNSSGIADDFSVRLMSGIYDEGYSGNAQSTHAVDRTWLISEAVAGGSEATLTFQWQDADQLSQFNPLDARVIHYDGTSWETLYEGVATGAGPYKLATSGVASFSPFGIESEGGVLPVNLLYFKGNIKQDAVRLAWATASEINNDMFILEKTTDLQHFYAIGKVKGKGTVKDTINTYHFYDRELSQGVTYYRLKQIDINGTFSYSEVIKIEYIDPLHKPQLSIYPVPCNGKYIKMRLNGIDSDKSATVAVYSIQGVLMYEQSLHIPKNDEIILNFGKKFPPGIYNLSITTPKRFIKQFIVR